MLKKTPLKKSSTPLKRTTPLKSNGKGLSRGKSLRAKPKTKEQIEAQKEQFAKDWEFYMVLWGEREHICVSCDKWLGHEPNLLFFEHGLPKSPNGGYPQYRYSKENVNLVCPDCHNLKESGFPTEKYKIKLGELLEKHKNGILK